jgi:hypothetical protein
MVALNSSEGGRAVSYELGMPCISASFVALRGWAKSF